MRQSAPAGLDTREGSVWYDAVAPAAVKLAEAYIQLDAVLELGFAETSHGEYLERRASELGVYRKGATKTKRQAAFNTAPGVGTRFFIDDLYYVVITDGTSGEVECESAGSLGNKPVSGSELLPVDTIPGLTTAVLGDVLVPGEDEETDTELYHRYTEEITGRPTSGNNAHYKQWVKEVVGVGDVKIFPLWSGNGTVKLVIVDANKDPAPAQLVQDVQNYLDPNHNGDGEGAAPLGAMVTVESAVTKTIAIAASLVLEEGKSIAEVRPGIEGAIADYFKSIVFQETVARYNKIGDLIFNASGVVDYSNLTVNGGTANIPLQDNEIPVLGTVTLNV